MEFTLDSIVHVETALEKTTKKKAKVTPYVTDDLTEFYDSKTEQNFFGVFTYGDNVENVLLKSFNDKDLILLTPNTQLIELFKYIEVNNSPNDLKGQFRGYLVRYTT